MQFSVVLPIVLLHLVFAVVYSANVQTENNNYPKPGGKDELSQAVAGVVGHEKCLEGPYIQLGVGHVFCLPLEKPAACKQEAWNALNPMDIHKCEKDSLESKQNLETLEMEDYDSDDDNDGYY